MSTLSELLLDSMLEKKLVSFFGLLFYLGILIIQNDLMLTVIQRSFLSLSLGFSGRFRSQSDYFFPHLFVFRILVQSIEDTSSMANSTPLSHRTHIISAFCIDSRLRSALQMMTAIHLSLIHI